MLFRQLAIAFEEAKENLKEFVLNVAERKREGLTVEYINEQTTQLGPLLKIEEADAHSIHDFEAFGGIYEFYQARATFVLKFLQ